MPRTKFTVSDHPRRNGWMNGTQKPIRNPEVFSLKLPVDWYDEIKEDISRHGWSKQEWGDHVIAAYYGKSLDGEQSDRDSQAKSGEKSEPDWEELKKEVLAKFKLGRQSATYKKIDQALDMMISSIER
ncbi:hypothetical protein [Coleofasciculus sp.]|uniref:hypothetical protein n=1 Tax=Coleofasciculus sp. TaxID=3100458 RepID=UPI003A3626C3